jgi:thiol-disulfide isomerase/thioredoxin
MNNIFVWIVGAVVIVGGGFFLYQNSATNSAKDAMMEKDEMVNEEDEMMKKDDATMEKTDDSMMKEDDGATMEKGSYETYAPEKLSKANSGDVVLFFRASWCPTCKAVDTDIRTHLSAIPGDLTILDVDYDNSTALKQKYGVTYQHTFVQVKADGTLIKKWSGSPTLVSLIAEVQ